MRIRTPHISEGAVTGARTVRDAARAALRSPEAATAIDRIVAKANFRRYRHGGAAWSHAAAITAAHAFFKTGARSKAERELSSGVDHAAELAELMDDIRYSRPFTAILEASTAAVMSRFPRLSPSEARTRTSMVLADEIAEAVIAADTSEPMDAIRGTELVVCYVPGLSEAARLEDTMTSHWTDVSSSLTVKPDTTLMRFLSLANISVEDWLDAVEAIHGERLDQTSGAEGWREERAIAWSTAEVLCNPSSRQLIKPHRLVEAVDACWLGFTPMIAFNADAGALCARDWERPMGVRGGVLGLHDFVNGSGDPLRFEHKAVFTANPADMMVGEARPCDFSEVHGFVRQSFRSRVTDEDLPLSVSLVP